VDVQVTAASPRGRFPSPPGKPAGWPSRRPPIPTVTRSKLLQQVNKSIPSEELHVTIFDQSTPAQFWWKARRPPRAWPSSTWKALRNNPELKAFHFDSGPPEILPNEHAHFRIFAKYEASSRERILAASVGAVVFVLLNLLLLSAFGRHNAGPSGTIGAQRIEWTAMQELLGEQGLWADRDGALTAQNSRSS